MKTIEEWFIIQPRPHATPEEHAAWLSSIQYDAWLHGWKQGMTNAAECCNDRSAKLILAQRDKL